MGLACLLPLLLAAAGDAVTVPADKPTTLVVVPSARVIIPAGRFWMGASADEVKQARAMCNDELRTGGALALELAPRCGTRFDGESPAAEVFVPAFAIDRTEVTVGAYAACVAEGACRAAPEVSLAAGRELPVEKITWLEATAYCRWRGGRLPTEAEWEKAARGPGRRVWPWGSTWLERRANHGRAERLGPQGGPPTTADDTLDAADGFAGRAPAGSFPGGASAFGVLDLGGNVWEWTAGYFGREPPQSSARFAPLGPPFGSERTIRGGSYRSPPSDLRVTRRLGLPPSERLAGVGFRCAYERAPGPAPGPTSEPPSGRPR
jgi:formylglycine-generating enzyme required for sulfatase activity